MIYPLCMIRQGRRRVLVILVREPRQSWTPFALPAMNEEEARELAHLLQSTEVQATMEDMVRACSGTSVPARRKAYTQVLTTAGRQLRVDRGQDVSQYAVHLAAAVETLQIMGSLELLPL